MAQAWDDMTPDDKIEDLKKDVIRILHILNETKNAAATDIVGLKAQVDSMKPWGPWMNQLQVRLDKLDGGQK